MKLTIAMLISLSLLNSPQIPSGGITGRSSPGATWTVVHNKAGDSVITGASYALTVTSTAANNLLVACSGWVGTSITLTSVTDNASGGSNTYVQASGAASIATGGTVLHGDCYYVLSAAHASATTITFNYSGSSSYHAGFVWEVSLSSGTAAFDTSNVADTQTGAGTDNTGAAVTTAAKGFIASIDVPNNSVTVAPKAGNAFTSNVSTGIAPNGPAGISLLSSGSGTYTPVWTNSIGNDVFCSSTVAFK